MHDIINQLALVEEIGGKGAIAQIRVYRDMKNVDHPQVAVSFLDPAVYVDQGEVTDRVHLDRPVGTYARLCITGDPDDDPLDLLAEAVDILQDATVAP
ncbi:hypothetical protein JVX90_00040 [Gordonia sp. PDNC005]|uniref:hypothetical protein n=1 Tax=Gordonia sp. PDNC005 TaxID=2811424 RepID=UPI00196547A3|nr:hypothetical protein [Gordonia sp. PDNC005]QRY62702.1 hypothetical protein JVX90_00040 [Gordonia sp. PDNC005]